MHFVSSDKNFDILKTIIESAYCTGVYGAFLLACYDEDREEFQSICKIGKSCSHDEAFSTEAENHKSVKCTSLCGSQTQS